MSEEIKTFGLDNDEIRGNQFTKYAGKKGEVHRCGIVYTDPKAMFVGTKVHYFQRYFICKKGLCCDKVGLAKYRIGAVLVKYATDNLGNPKKPFGYEILPWMFGEQTYTKLKTADSEFPLASHDIKISCTNEDYQNLDINSCRESIWQAKAELKESILAEAKHCWEWVKKGLASDLSVEEIKDLILGTQTSSEGAADPVAPVNLDDVLKSV